VSRGIAIGRAHKLAPAALDVQHYLVAEELLEAEVRRLQRENEVLRQERDFAKKAAAYFAKELR